MRRIGYFWGLLCWACMMLVWLPGIAQGVYTVHIPKPQHGVIKSLSGQRVEEGKPVELEIVPDEGWGLKPKSLYYCHHATGGDRRELRAQGGQCSFLMPAYDVRVVGEFARLYSLRISNEVDVRKGSITFLPADRVFAGSEVKVEVRANAGYRLKPHSLEYRYGIEPWQPVLGGKLMMPSYDVEVRADFQVDEESTYRVFSDPSLGEGVIGVNPILAKGGQEVQVRVVAPQGMLYVEGSLRWCKGTEKSQREEDWTRIVDGKFVMPPSTHVFVTADLAVDESAKYSVRIDTSVVNLDPHALQASPSTKLREGDMVTIRAQAPDGYQFVGESLEWRREDGNEWMRIDGTTFRMPSSDVVVRGTFKKKVPIGHRYRISIATISGGVVYSARGSEALPGARVALLVQPLGGYALLEGGLTYEPVDGGGAVPIYLNANSTEYAFTMPECDVLIRAQFVRVFQIGVWREQDLSRGSIEISPAGTVQPGKRVEIRAKAKAGNVYVVGSLEWSGDGGSRWLPVENSFIEMPEADVAVRALFVEQVNEPKEQDKDKAVYLPVHLRSEGQGSLVVLNGTEALAQEARVLKGSKLLLRALPADGHRLAFILVNEQPYRDSVLTLEKEATILARFVPDRTTAVEEGQRIGYSPNPFEHELHVEFQGRATVSLYDASGMLQVRTSGHEGALIDAEGLRPGVYLLRIRSESGAIFTYRVVKQ